MPSENLLEAIDRSLTAMGYRRTPPEKVLELWEAEPWTAGEPWDMRVRMAAEALGPHRWPVVDRPPKAPAIRHHLTPKKSRKK